MALILTAAIYPGGLVGLSQDALRAAGLRSEQVTPLSGSGATNGLKVTVSGGYADQVSTVLFVSIEQDCHSPACGIGGGPYVTDQFGTRYNIMGGEGIGVGAYPMFFEPLTRAAASGARLTLHIPTNVKDLAIALSGTIRSSNARNLALPSPVVDNVAGVTYEVTNLLYSGTYLQVHTRLSGKLDNVIVHYPPSGQMLSGEGWPGVYLVDSSGKWELDVAGGPGTPTVNNQLQDETRIFSVAKPGTYRIVVANSANANSAPGASWKSLASWEIQVH